MSVGRVEEPFSKSIRKCVRDAIKVKLEHPTSSVLLLLPIVVPILLQESDLEAHHYALPGVYLSLLPINKCQPSEDYKRTEVCHKLVTSCGKSKSCRCQSIKVRPSLSRNTHRFELREAQKNLVDGCEARCRT
jgi:hypothetical protein